MYPKSKHPRIQSMHQAILQFTQMFFDILCIYIEHAKPHHAQSASSAPLQSSCRRQLPESHFLLAVPGKIACTSAVYPWDSQDSCSLHRTFPCRVKHQLDQGQQEELQYQEHQQPETQRDVKDSLYTYILYCYILKC